MFPDEWHDRYPDPETRAHKRALATDEVEAQLERTADWWEQYLHQLREGGAL